MLTVWEAIFPTPVLRTNIGRDFREDELKFFVEAQNHTIQNVLNTRTISTHVLDAPEMQSIQAFIREHINQFGRKTVSLGHLEFYITQSWINFTKPGEAHHRHFHTNSLISGVFYISAVKEVDGICFYRNAPSTVNVYDKVENSYCANSWRFCVGAGDLIIFPSSVTHGVDNNKGGHTRVSLAFNTFAHGQLGSDELLNELNL